MKLASVPGTMMMVWAKMIGITPAVMSRIGMKVFCPSRIRPRPMTFRGIWIGIRRAAMVIATTAATTATRIARNDTAPKALTTPDSTNWMRCRLPGQRRSRIENVMSRLMPLPMPRSVICSPSHITKIAPVVSVTTMMRREAKPGFDDGPGNRLGEQGEGVRLGQRDEHGEIPGPLRDLLLALLVLLHLADRRRDAAGQLEDDRGGDVGHDPEREHRGPGESTAEGVVQAEEAGGGGVPDEVSQRGDVDARGGDVGADPVDHQSREA